jgi:diguanylate cyclase (GGDEF)-like protein
MRKNQQIERSHHPGAPGTTRHRWTLFPLGIRTSLVAIVLLPLALVVGLASTVVVNQSAVRGQAVMAGRSSLYLNSLLRARIDVYTEYVDTASIVAAQAYRISDAELDSLLGLNVRAALISARRAVNDQKLLGPSGIFAAEHAQLEVLRRAVTRGSTSPAEVESFFNRFGSTMDARWESTFESGANASQAADSVETRSRLAGLRASFEAFTSGLGEESLQGGGSLETVLTTTSTPAGMESLVVSHGQFEETTSSFPAVLGPQGAAAWKVLVNGRLSGSFEHYVTLGIAAALGQKAPPFADDSAAISAIAKSEVAWSTSLTNVVLASSADLRVAAATQADSATRALYLTCLFMLLFVLGAIGSVLAFSRAVRRPLARIAAALKSVHDGELEFPELDESGPREISQAAEAFNEMSSTLRTVQAQAIALSNGQLDDPVLQRPLPGQTGAALQAALNKLQVSVRASEMQRGELIERATRDSLTGLLNRGAALEALDLDLASARRSQGELVLTLLFLDLDELKKINDTLGHDGGDEAIRAVAVALRAATRASDVIARFGGDEFIVGWLGRRNSEAPALLATRISELISSSVVEGDGSCLKLGCSIGVAVSMPYDSTVESLIERADHALYVAKANGRGQVRWFGAKESPRVDHDASGRFVGAQRVI